jgi:hypothetical protein
MRGEFQKFLGKQSDNRRNTPGLDYNAYGQAANAVAGSQNFRANNKPRQDQGTAYQNFLRNKPNEQAGVATPAQAAMAPNVLSMKRN